MSKIVKETTKTVLVEFSHSEACRIADILEAVLHRSSEIELDSVDIRQVICFLGIVSNSPMLTEGE